MKHHINDMKRRALHNADAAYYVLDYLAHSFPVQLYEVSRWPKKRCFADSKAERAADLA